MNAFGILDKWVVSLSVNRASGQGKLEQMPLAEITQFAVFTTGEGLGA